MNKKSLIENQSPDHEGNFMKKLPTKVKVKGTGIPGLTANLLRRTDKVAWFLRNDGYHEVFLIRVGQTFDGSGTMEYYPGYTNFGISAWCTSDFECAARSYQNLCLGKPVDARMETEMNCHIIKKKSRKIRRTHNK